MLTYLNEQLVHDVIAENADGLNAAINSREFFQIFWSGIERKVPRFSTPMAVTVLHDITVNEMFNLIREGCELCANSFMRCFSEPNRNNPQTLWFVRGNPRTCGLYLGVVPEYENQAWFGAMDCLVRTVRILIETTIGLKTVSEIVDKCLKEILDIETE